MKYLAPIIGFLNSELAAAISCRPAQHLGLCQPARRKKDEKDVTWPVEFDLNGEGADATPDDRFVWSSYHRSISMSTSRMPGGYGDNPGNVKILHRMSLVIWAQQNKIEMSQDEISLLVHVAIPDRLKKEQHPGITSVSFNITDVVLNIEQVFNEEFKNVDYFILPEHTLLKVNYTIESILSKACFNTLCSKANAA